MIVTILKKLATFKGVSYNTNKVEKEKGELMKVANFGALQAMEHLRPQDYINYLEAWSARSGRIKYPQFHVAISARGRSHSKAQLTGLAEQWLQGMGYGDNPYLLIFHKDTKNNHIHLVTTRIGRDGRKIDDSYEKIRAYQVLNRIMGTDEKQALTADLDKALAYRFSTRAQFMMILEAQGYALRVSGAEYLICKYGKELARVELAKVDAVIAAHQKNTVRIKQLRAIIDKYRLRYDPAIYPLSRELPGGKAGIHTGYSSKLAELLREKFGLQVLFHARDNKPPYGYTLLDHGSKTVFKGGEIMDLAAFIAPVAGINNRPDTSASVFREGAEPFRYPDESWPDAPAEHAAPAFETGQSWEESGTSLPELQLDIADDIDDEAILGRNRHRKRKARTNTR